MWNRTRDVIKNRNRVEKELKARRKSEIAYLKNKSAFKAKLYDELKHLEVILQDKDIEAVGITVPDRFLTLFSNAIYDEDLAGYDVVQVEGESNKFLIKRKYISL